MKKLKNKLNNQRGSALLLTLGVLSLALMLAMAFAFSSRTSRQVARVNADQIKARLLAESALERVIAAMKLNSASNEYPPVQMMIGASPDNTPNFVFSKHENTSATPPWQLRYLVSKGTILTGSNLSDFDELIELGKQNDFIPTSHYITSSLPTRRGYQDITIGGNTVGRIAFLVLEEANKLDINEMLSINPQVPFVISGEERLASFTSTENSYEHFFYDIVGDGTWQTLPSTASAYEEDIVRLGLHMREMRADNKYYTNLLPGNTSATGTKTMWFSYFHLMNVLWKPTLPATLPDQDSLKYTFFSGEDIEAYWDGLTLTERQRFDITGYEWGSISGDFYVEYPASSGKYIPDPTKSGWHHSGTLAGAQALVNALVGDTARAEFFNDATRTALKAAPGISDSGFGIPYLKTLEDATTNQGKQIAANMVDFCDVDNFATLPAGWDGESAPSYCGNEKVAYINELAVTATVFKVEDNAGPPPTYQYRFEIRLVPEMLNIFCDTITVGRCKATIFGGAQVKVDSAPYVDLPLFNASTPLEITFTDQADMAGVFFIPASGVIPTVELDLRNNIPETTTITYQIKITKIVVTTDDDNGPASQIYDVASWVDASVGWTAVDATTDGDATGYPLCAVWSVEDPRLNHESDSWQHQAFILGESDSSDIRFSNGALNPCFITEAASVVSADLEDYAAMDFSAIEKTFSTAFIPNRPFRNFWELGAIHRGEPYRTLDIAGDDAELLDQVKIGSLKRTRGKFNANSTNPAAFVELLEGIDITEKYDDAYSYSTTAYTAPASLDTTTSFSRGVFAKKIPDSGLYTTEPANDREREALIGRTANLLTTRMDKYTILVVGQAIKKLDDSVSSNWAEIKKSVVNPYDDASGYYSILATQRILAHVVRDAWRNEYKIVQMQLLED